MTLTTNTRSVDLHFAGSTDIQQTAVKLNEEWFASGTWFTAAQPSSAMNHLLSVLETIDAETHELRAANVRDNPGDIVNHIDDILDDIMCHVPSSYSVLEHPRYRGSYGLYRKADIDVWSQELRAARAQAEEEKEKTVEQWKKDITTEHSPKYVTVRHPVTGFELDISFE